MLGKIKLVACEQELIPPLVTGEIDSIILENTYEMGYRAVQLIAAERRGEHVPEQITLSPKLVTRENLNSPEVQRMLTMNWRSSD
jgi:ribose transport system substrate-binding protein